MVQGNLLQDGEVRLAALTRADLHTLFRWYQNAEFMRLYDSRPAYPKTEEQLSDWLDARHKAHGVYLFAIRSLGSDELVGMLELEGIEWSHGAGWLSIAIGERTNWGKGYGTSAAKLALRFAFHELNLHRMQLTVFAYNDRAIRLYESLGFQREGTFREFLNRDGERHDMPTIWRR